VYSNAAEIGIEARLHETARAAIERFAAAVTRNDVRAGGGIGTGGVRLALDNFFFLSRDAALALALDQRSGPGGKEVTDGAIANTPLKPEDGMERRWGCYAIRFARGSDAV
jgi:hypothetical protein